MNISVVIFSLTKSGRTKQIENIRNSNSKYSESASVIAFRVPLSNTLVRYIIQKFVDFLEVQEDLFLQFQIVFQNLVVILCIPVYNIFTYFIIHDILPLLVIVNKHCFELRAANMQNETTYLQGRVHQAYCKLIVTACCRRVLGTLQFYFERRINRACSSQLVLFRPIINRYIGLYSTNN